MIFLLVLGGMLPRTGDLVSPGCELQMSPRRVFVKYGDPLQAVCSSTSDITGMGWESIYNGTGLQKGVSSLPLHIQSVETWTIEPICYANLPNGHQCTSTLEVIVYNPPESVNTSQLSMPLVEGRRYSVRCDIANVAPLNSLVAYCYMGDQNVTTKWFEDSSPQVQNASFAFEFVAHRKDSGSNLWCEAKLRLELDEQNPPLLRSKSQQLTIFSPPEFDMASDETVELPAGKTIILNCTATGNPAPAYRWRFPKPDLATDGEQSAGEPVVTPAFPVPGTYVCTASNSLGNSTKYFSVVRASESHTTFAALLGVFVTAGVLLLISGLFFVTPSGTFSFNKSGYIPGLPTPSALV